MENNVALTILEQLGGNKFLVMTGAKNLLFDKNSLRMQLPKNVSGANRLKITLDALDTYTVEFFKYTPARLNKKTFTFTDEKIKEIRTLENIYNFQLKEIFEQTTGLYTSLF